MANSDHETEISGDLRENDHVRMPTSTTRPQSGAPQLGELGEVPDNEMRQEEVICSICDRSFKPRGLGQHMKRAHPEEANELINIDRTKRRWTNEEIRLLAGQEARAERDGVANINQHLLGLHPTRTLDGIKGKRKQEVYRVELERIRRELDEEETDRVRVEGGNTSQARRNDLREVLRVLVDEVKQIRNKHARVLQELGEAALRGEGLNETKLLKWFSNLFPNVRKPRGPVHSRVTTFQGTNKQIRKQKYAYIQKLYRSNFRAAARAILDREGTIPLSLPGQDEMLQFWARVFSGEGSSNDEVNTSPGEEANGEPLNELRRSESDISSDDSNPESHEIELGHNVTPSARSVDVQLAGEGHDINSVHGNNVDTSTSRADERLTGGIQDTGVARGYGLRRGSIQIDANRPVGRDIIATEDPSSVGGLSENPDLASMWNPVTMEELKGAKTENGSAAGPDGISPESWNKIDIRYKLLLYNLFVFYEGVPKALQNSRTVLIPKEEGGSTDPGDFRPLTICSVVLREFNKVLARRLVVLHHHDPRQTAYQPLDGVGMNVVITTAIIAEARRKLQELHIAILDLAKAFNSIFHEAIKAGVEELGYPKGFVAYITQLYEEAFTVLQFEGRELRAKVGAGVYQGDPLSGLIFLLVFEKGLRALDKDVGFELGTVRCNAGAYSDDNLLYASTREGLQRNINLKSTEEEKVGLLANPRKSNTLSLVPSGREKKMKVVKGKPFIVGGEVVKEIGVLDAWKYLGVRFEGTKVAEAKDNISTCLQRLTEAPLKPQQRLRLLKLIVIPRFQCRLIDSRTTAAGLKKIDVQIRRSVKQWLKLPHDVPNAYLHAPVKAGGLGVACFQFWIPLLRLRKLERLGNSNDERVKEALGTEVYSAIIRRCRQTLRFMGSENPSVRDYDRFWKEELRSKVDGKDLEGAEVHTSSTSWVSWNSDRISGEDYVHYHQLRANCLPTRVRTARGRPEKQVLCRAGCHSTETSQHVIQMCDRTHDVVVMRHDRVVGKLGDEFRRKKYRVEREKHLRIGNVLRKPDLLIMKGGLLHVVDAQVRRCRTLEKDHKDKVEYYQNEPGLTDLLKRTYRVSEVRYHSCTLSYKGIWSKSSVGGLKELGVSDYCLFEIVTSVLRGSWIGWKTFNARNNVVRY